MNAPRWRTRFLPASLLLLSGCLTDVLHEDLGGNWSTVAEDLSPSGWYQTRLSFRPYGAFEQEVRSYGSYPGQTRNDLSGYSRIEGTYWTEEDRVFFRPRRQVSWDRFYGPDSPEYVEEPYRTQLYDAARFSVQGDRLLLQYVSYPFDAPVSTSREFVRED